MTKADMQFCALMLVALVIVIGMGEGMFGPYFKALVGMR